MWPPRRFADEPVRHVALDMIGDLAVVGAPIEGRIVAHNPLAREELCFGARAARFARGLGHGLTPSSDPQLPAEAEDLQVK